MGASLRLSFLRKVREISHYLGDDVTVEQDNRDEVIVRTTTPHYVPRGRIYHLVLPGGADVSVKMSSWVGKESAQPDQEYCLEDFLALQPEEFARFGSEYVKSL